MHINRIFHECFHFQKMIGSVYFLSLAYSWALDFAFEMLNIYLDQFFAFLFKNSKHFSVK